MVRILQGRDVRSVRALDPDPRMLERGFHDVTIVDMGDLPEPSVSMDELSLLRRQWPATVLRIMVWLQHLDTMRGEAKKHFRSIRPGIVPTVENGLNATCIAMWLHITWTWASCGGVRCTGARCGRARHRTAWIMSGGGGGA